MQISFQARNGRYPSRIFPSVDGFGCRVRFDVYAVDTGVCAGGGGGGGGSAPAPKITTVADSVAKSKDEVAEVKNPAVDSEEEAAAQPDERTAELPGFGNRSGKIGDETAEPEEKTPAVSELTAKEHEERTLAIKDPVGESGTNSEDRIGAEADGEVNDETDAHGDETTGVGNNDIADETDYIRADIGFATQASRVEEGDVLKLRIRITQPLPRSVTVVLSMLFGARPGVDVDNVPASLTFAPGETIKDLEIAIVDDAQPEHTEVVAFHLDISPESDPPDGVRFDTHTHIVTIIDNDVAEDEIAEVGDIVDEVDGVEARVGFAASASEVREGGVLSLRVQLSKQISQPVTVSVVQLTHGFITISDSLTFAPGETSKVIELVITDPWLRADPTYILGGVNLPDGVSFGQLVHRVTIIENDSDDVAVEDVVLARVGFVTSASEVKEGESLLLSVQLSEPLPRDLTLFALAPVGDVVSRRPYVFFPKGETSAVLEITAVDDEHIENTETVTYTLGGPGSGVRFHGVGTVIFDSRTHAITIIDNDGVEKGQVPEAGDSAKVIEGDTGTSASGPDRKTGDTTITTAAETATETFPAVRWTGQRRADGSWENSWDVDGTVTNAITSGTVDNGSVGVHIVRTGEGHLVFVNDADISNVEYGIQATSDALGRLGIINGNAKITDVVYGIDARYTGTDSFGVWVGHDGIFGDWRYPSSFAHPVRSSEITALQRGVFAQHGGSGSLAVGVKPTGKVVSKESDAIVAEHKGEGKVFAYIEGEVKGARTGVVAKHNNGGNVEVYVRPGGRIHGDASAIIAEGEEVFVDLAGEVTAGSDGDGIAVDMRGVDGNNLRLRPGFSSGGTIVAKGEDRSGSLILHPSHYAHLHPTEQIGYLDLGDFRGFDVFELDSWNENEWQVTGAVSDGEAFRKAFVGNDAILRFTNAEFKMAEWVHRDGKTVTDEHGVSWRDGALVPNSSWGQGIGTFNMSWHGDATLEIVGDNTIRGNLTNFWGGNSVYGRIQRRYPHLTLEEIYGPDASFIVFNSVGGEDRLTVTGDYRGYGFLIFDIGLDGWDENDGFVIEGGTLRADPDSNGNHIPRTNSLVLIGTPEEGTPSLGEESPVLIKVQGESDADAFFGMQDVGAFRYVLDHEAVGEVAPDIDRMRSDAIKDYYDGLVQKARDDYQSHSGSWKERDSALADDLAEAGRVLEDARAGRSLGDAHRALEETLANFPGEDDFDGYHTWRFRRKGPSSLAVNSSALAPILSKSGEPLETPSGSHKKRDGSGLGFLADTREYDGGIWGQRQNLRASQDLGVIAGGSSRMSGERIHFGYDTPAMNLMGGDMVVGANIWHGTSASDVSSSVGTGDIDVESQAAALTASWWSHEGLYASGQTQYVRFLSDISADGLSLVKDNEGIGVNTSAELGYRFAVPLGGMNFEVAPQTQLVWSHVGFEDFAGLQGELVSLEDGDLVTGRLGLSWNGEWGGVGGLGRFYGGVNLRGAVDGKTSVSISGVSVANEHKGLSFDGNLGLSYEWDEGYAVHGGALATHHDDAEEVRVDMGVQIDF